MPSYRVTTKRSMMAMGQYVDAGMSVVISSVYNVNQIFGPVADQVQRAFLNQYGVDLKKMGILNGSFLRIEKL